ncbi:MAG: hypothetical protein JL55_13560 [Pseudomonas sp. BICA1-14]|nr:MAG: hypothetical protein JL55_13560 [[Pseudomonas] sp. BICA1-14]
MLFYATPSVSCFQGFWPHSNAIKKCDPLSRQPCLEAKRIQHNDVCLVDLLEILIRGRNWALVPKSYHEMPQQGVLRAL